VIAPELIFALVVAAVMLVVYAMRRK